MIITLTTDFGLKNSYAGVMKGVILGINPEAKIIDLTHDISPQHLEEAAVTIKHSYSFFPKNTIHTIVVDPTVGSTRNIIIVKAAAHTFLAPDNGVLHHIFSLHPDCIVYRIEKKDFFLERISATFHGRDIFAPCAARLSLGHHPHEFGPQITSWEKGRFPGPRAFDHGIRGRIIMSDRYGNCITNITRAHIPQKAHPLISTATHQFNEIKNHYSEAQPGEPLALFGSYGELELSVRNGSAVKSLNLKPGAGVQVTWKECDKT